jgi:RES domain-containing protein
VSVTVWRICHRKHVRSVFSGIGAFQRGGRWNRKRRHRVVYTSDSLALATLEMLAGIEDPEQIDEWLVASAVIPRSFIRECSPSSLPPNWRNHPYPVETQTVGDEWIVSQSSAVLRVPTTVIDHGFNYLLNPAHPDFGKIEFGSPAPARFDRLKRIFILAVKPAVSRSPPRRKRKKR